MRSKSGFNFTTRLGDGAFFIDTTREFAPSRFLIFWEIVASESSFFGDDGDGEVCCREVVVVVGLGNTLFATTGGF